MNNRIKSFLWRAGLYVIVAISAYTGNIGDIQEISLSKLLTIFVVSLSIYAGNEGTKYLNSSK